MSRLIGFLVSIAIAIIAFLVGYAVSGVLVGSILTVVTLYLFFRFNIRESTTGLIRANLYVYFLARRNGESHQTALHAMVETRYPQSLETQRKLLEVFQMKLDAMKKTFPDLTSKTEVQMLVFDIFCHSNGEPPEEYGEKILNQIESIYDEFAAKQ